MRPTGPTYNAVIAACVKAADLHATLAALQARRMWRGARGAGREAWGMGRVGRGVRREALVWGSRRLGREAGGSRDLGSGAQLCVR